MSDKFLGTGGSSVNISNGTATLFGATIGANNLDPSQPIKTNAVRQLVSSKLDIADTTNLQSELNIKNELQFTESDIHATPPAGRLVIYAKTDKKMYQKDDTGTEAELGGGNPFNQTLNTTDSVDFASLSINATTGNTLLHQRPNNTIPANLAITTNGNFQWGAGCFGGTIADDWTIYNFGFGKGIIARAKDSDARFAIGEIGTDYSLPRTRGTAGQIIKDVSGNGDLQWVADSSGFDQSLNTTDAVEFKKLTIDDTLNGIIELQKAGVVQNYIQSNGDYTLRDASNVEKWRMTQAGNVVNSGSLTVNGAILSVNSSSSNTLQQTRANGFVSTHNFATTGNDTMRIYQPNTSNNLIVSNLTQNEDIAIFDAITYDTTLQSLKTTDIEINSLTNLTSNNGSLGVKTIDTTVNTVSTETVPAGAGFVIIRAWGAGGQGGTTNVGGGGGAFVESKVAVIPGDSFNYYIGEGGNNASAAGTIAEGGLALAGGSNTARGGGGTVIAKNNGGSFTLVAVAGGGGSGGGSATHFGGYGGQPGADGQNSFYSAAGGGNNGIGGAGGGGVGLEPGDPGSNMNLTETNFVDFNGRGGNTFISGDGAGSGGGGYGGGGSGSGAGNDAGAGGGSYGDIIVNGLNGSAIGGLGAGKSQLAEDGLPATIGNGGNGAIITGGIGNGGAVSFTYLKPDGELLIDTDVKIDGSLTITDGNTLQLGDTSDISTTKCMSIVLTSSAAIGAGLVCKIIDVGGVAKIDTVKFNDPDATGVIGISMTSTSGADEDIKICVGGIFEGVVENGTTISIGQMLEKSDTNGQDGRLLSNPAGTGSPGTFGVAISSGTGDAGGTVKVRGLFIKNESF